MIMRIAWREYLQFVLRRGFIISMLLMPAWVLVSGLIPLLTERATPPLNFTVIDRSGSGISRALDEALTRSWARETLDGLNLYARTSIDMPALEKAFPDLAAWLKSLPSITDAQAAILSQGGIDALVTRLGPYEKPGAFSFTPPRIRYIQVKPSSDLASPDVAAFREAAFKALSSKAQDTKLGAILVIPERFGNGEAKVAFWSKELSAARFIAFVKDALALELRLRAMMAKGMTEEEARQTQRLVVQVDTFDPSPEAATGPTSWLDRVRSIAPLAMAGILFFVVFLSSTMLLGSVIEDKSSRVIEVMLSCVPAWTLMAGKLAGAGMAALTIFAIWFIVSLAGLFFAPESAQVWRIAFEAILRLDFLPLALIFFALAFLIYTSLFLMVGSLAKSPQDTQAYVGPLMLVVILPFFFVGVIMLDPNGGLARTMSFIPLYAPFIGMIRLPYDPPLTDILWILGISTAMAIFCIWFAGRVFARNAVQVESEGGPGFWRRLLGT